MISSFASSQPATSANLTLIASSMLYSLALDLPTLKMFWPPAPAERDIMK